MTVMLDTSVVIALGGLDLGPAGDEPPVVSSITVGELAYGLDLGEEVVRERRRLRLQQVLTTLEIVPFGVEEAKLYGVLATLVREAGRNPRPRRLDLQIAATAAAARLPLATMNPRDFVGVDRLVTIIPIS